MNEDYVAETARQGAQIETLQREMKEARADIKKIEEIASSVKELALSVKAMAENMTKLENKVDIIKAEPADNWKKLKGTIGTVIISVIGGGILTALLSLIMK